MCYTGGGAHQASLQICITGDVMPQNGSNYEGRRRGPRLNTSRANSEVSSHVPGTGLVNEAVVHNGCWAAATKPCKSTPAVTMKPRCMVNGYINHGYKAKSTKAPPSRTLGKQGNEISAVTDASAAGRVSSEAIPGGVSVNGASRLDAVYLPCNSDQMAPEPSLPAAAKNYRRSKKFRNKKRPSPTPPIPPHKEEDWENEIGEDTVTDWEKICFGNRTNGPKDVLHFALRDLTLKQRDKVDLPVTANYSPAIHHPRPLQWSCYKIPTEPDQFADADE